MSALDIGLLAVLLVAAVIGAVKGLIRQLGVVVAVILGVVLALKYGTAVSGYLEPYIRSDGARNILAPFLVFLVVYMAVIVATAMVHNLLHKVRLGWMNRTSGAVFGFLTAAVPLGAILLLLVAYVPASHQHVADSPVAYSLMRGSEALLRLMPVEAREAFERGKAELERLLKRYQQLPGVKNETVT
jgi:membrane protein required for colicin V production